MGAIPLNTRHAKAYTMTYHKMGRNHNLNHSVISLKPKTKLTYYLRNLLSTYFDIIKHFWMVHLVTAQFDITLLFIAHL